jgi:hypothetical protein
VKVEEEEEEGEDGDEEKEDEEEAYHGYQILGEEELDDINEFIYYLAYVAEKAKEEEMADQLPLMSKAWTRWRQ